MDIFGNAFVTGQTLSSDFPTTPGAFQTTLGGSHDAFVTKLNSTGTNLLYSTYLGGSIPDYGNGIAVDTSGNAYVTGYTSSSDFPTTPGAFQTTYTYVDAFVTKLNATGTGLLYSTYLGGSGGDLGWGIAVDTSGNAYVTGQAQSSTDFPTTAGAFQTTYGGREDVFVTKLNSAGPNLLYSTYLGGSDFDYGNGIAVDFSGNAYVTGVTYSDDFPTTSWGLPNDAQRWWVLTRCLCDSAQFHRVPPFSTPLISAGAVRITATASRWTPPATPTLRDRRSRATCPLPLAPSRQQYGGYFDVFVTKLNSTGTALLYSTYLGGGFPDFGYGIAVDTFGNAYVAGYASSYRLSHYRWRLPDNQPSWLRCLCDED